MSLWRPFEDSEEEKEEIAHAVHESNVKTNKKKNQSWRKRKRGDNGSVPILWR